MTHPKVSRAELNALEREDREQFAHLLEDAVVVFKELWPEHDPFRVGLDGLVVGGTLSRPGFAGAIQRLNAAMYKESAETSAAARELELMVAAAPSIRDSQNRSRWGIKGNKARMNIGVKWVRQNVSKWWRFSNQLLWEKWLAAGNRGLERESFLRRMREAKQRRNAGDTRYQEITRARPVKPR